MNMYRYPSNPNSSWPPLWFDAGSSTSRSVLWNKIQQFHKLIKKGENHTSKRKSFISESVHFELLINQIMYPFLQLWTKASIKYANKATLHDSGLFWHLCIKYKIARGHFFLHLNLMKFLVCGSSFLTVIITSSEQIWTTAPISLQDIQYSLYKSSFFFFYQFSATIISGTHMDEWWKNIWGEGGLWREGGLI